MEENICTHHIKERSNVQNLECTHTAQQQKHPIILSKKWGGDKLTICQKKDI